MNTMNALIPNEVGIWIECCDPDCKKWRYTKDFDDPLLVPEEWYCRMNSDQSINSCSVPECLKLEEDEIFVESKFKAGCIVWAKVIGYPWSPAMVDFCPEYECYYWFEYDNTNVPSHYHVTFLSEKQVTRAWIESKFIKSFAQNKDPAFVLKSRVCNKALTQRQRASILEGWEIARTALRLSIPNRLKKYNFNSWRLSQRFQNLSTASGKTLALPSDSQITDKSSGDAPGPSGAKNTAASKTTQAIKPAAKKRQSKSKKILSPRYSDEKPAPLSKKKLTRVEDKKLSQKKANEKRSAGQKQKPALNDSETSVETSILNSERRNKNDDLDDTRSINSFSLKDFSEGLGVTVGKSTTVGKRVAADIRSLCNGPTKDILADKILSSKELIRELEMGDDLDEIIPSSQDSSPSIRSFISNVSRVLEEAKNIVKKNRPVASDSGIEIANAGKEFGAAVLSAKNFQPRSLFPHSSMTGKRSKELHASYHKSISESFITNDKENRENNHQEEVSVYRKALSEFKPRERDLSFSSMASSYPRRAKVSSNKPLPNWVTNPDEKKKIVAQRLDRISKLSEEDDKRMYQENRRSFIAEMEAVTADHAAAGPSGKGNMFNSNRKNYSIESQNHFDDLLSSDEDSF